jgi:transcription initiation factor TFIID subunit 7
LTIKGQGLNQTHKTDSFLGGYDRMLDENPEEPLYFEEQFILRVPREVAEGKDGLRERVKKGGLDGVEFKFFGADAFCHCPDCD